MQLDEQIAPSSGAEAQPETPKAPEQLSDKDMMHFLDTGEMPKKAEAEPEQAPEPEAEAKPTQDIPENQPESGAGKQKAKGAEYRKQQLAREVQEALARRAEVLQDLQMLEERRKALMEQPKPPDSTPGADSLTEPKLEDFEDYQSYDKARLAYIEARAEKKALDAIEKKLAEREKALREHDQKTQAEKAAQTWVERVEAVKSRMADYDEVVTFNDELGAHITPEMVQAIRELDNGPEVAYHLGKNTAEAARLKALPPHKLLIEIGKLEARISQPAQKPNGTAKPQPVVKPLPRELGTGSGAVDPIADALARGDFKTYEQLMDAKERRR